MWGVQAGPSFPGTAAKTAAARGLLDGAAAEDPRARTVRAVQERRGVGAMRGSFVLLCRT